MQEGVWNVQSQTGLSEDGYCVTKKSDTCSLSVCNIRCTKPECGYMCRHMYSCECYDFANGHICKHVHAVHIHVNTATAATDVDTEIEHHSDVLTCTPTTSEKENILPGTH